MVNLTREELNLNNKLRMEKKRKDPSYNKEQARKAIIGRIKKGSFIKNETLILHNITSIEIDKLRTDNGLEILNMTIDTKTKNNNHKIEPKINPKINMQLFKKSKIKPIIYEYDFLTLQEVFGFYKETMNINTYMLHYNTLNNIFNKYDKTINIIPILDEPFKLYDFINDNYKNPHSNLIYFRVLVKLVGSYPNLDIKLKEGTYDIYIRFFKNSKRKEHAYRADKTNNLIEEFDNIKSKIINKYPIDSDERLIIELYDSLPLRDNYGNCILIKSKKYAIEPDQNYIIYKKKKKKCVLILRKYKTSKVNGEVIHEFPSIIYDILKIQGKDFNDLLISKKNKDYKLDGFVKRILDDIEIERNGNSQNIYLLRHSKLTDLLRNATIEEREIIGKKVGHSPLVSLEYMRKYKSDL